MDFQSLIRYKALHQCYSGVNSALVDQAMGQMTEAEKAEFKLKKLQFDVSAQLFDQVESVCQLLDMSKREFLESAVSDAVKRAHEIIDGEGVLDVFEAASTGHEGSH